MLISFKYSKPSSQQHSKISTPETIYSKHKSLQLQYPLTCSLFNISFLIFTSYITSKISLSRRHFQTYIQPLCFSAYNFQNSITLFLWRFIVSVNKKYFTHEQKMWGINFIKFTLWSSSIYLTIQWLSPHQSYYFLLDFFSPRQVVKQPFIDSSPT